MNVFKKTVSLVLSICLIMSVTFVGLTAFAAEKPEKITALEQKITAYNGNLSVAEPTQEDLDGYNEIVSGFRVLTDEEKELVDVYAFDLLLKKVYDREFQLAKAEGVSTSSSVLRKEAHIRGGNVLGYPSYIAEAQTLAETLANTGKTVDEKAEAFAAASVNARLFSGLWYKSYSNFYYALATYPINGAKAMAKVFYDDINKKNPFTGTQPSSISKPKASDYAEGENDPAYIAAMEAYLQRQLERAEYTVGKYKYEGAQQIEAFEKLVAIAPEYAALLEILKTGLTAKACFEADKSDVENAKKAVALYEKLDDREKVMYDKWGIYVDADVVTSSSTGYTYKSYNPSAIYTYCNDIQNYDTVVNFETVIASVSEPYTNDDIATVKEAYEKVPSNLKMYISAEATEKYAAVLACIAPDAADETMPDLSVYEETKVEYPFFINNKNAASTANEAGKIIEKLLADSISAEKIFSNQMVGDLAKLLYPLLGGLTSLLEKGPTDLAAKLTEEKFAGAAAVLLAAASVDENGKVVKNLEDWNKEMTFKNGDWGFTDGDKEGFLDAAAAIFRPFSILTMALKFENTISTTNGTYTYNAYEDLVPVFEMLDLDGVVSSHDYTLVVNAAESSDAKMDARIRQILVPVANLLEKLANDPVNTVYDLLPKAAYLIDSGLLDDQIHKLTSKIGMVTIGEYSLKTDAIYDMIAPALTDIEINQGVAFTLTLEKENFLELFEDLSGSAKAVVKPSVERGHAYRLGLESDKGKTFVSLFYWLYGELTSEANAASINGLVDSIEMNSALRNVVKIAVSLLRRISPESAFVIVAVVLPLVNRISTFQKTFSIAF
ncbi:MAG: hypothetical protein ACI4I3_02905 [Acutalibacteraceae bacterium]